jgi:hypothetical protein
MTYGLVFWGNSYYSNTVVKLRKRIIRIMVGIKMLPLQSQYIYLLLIFVINNRQNFKIHSDIHNINSRNDLDLLSTVSSVSLPEGYTLHWD